MKQLKRRLYIYVYGEGDEACYLATDDPSDAVGASSVVGIYELVEKLEVRQVTEFRREKTQRWFR